MVREIRKDQRRVKHMIALNLRATPRYPVINALLCIFCAPVADLEEKDNSLEADRTVSIPSLQKSNITDSFIGQGANIDGPALIANGIHSTTISDNYSANRLKTEESQGTDPIHRLTSIAVVNTATEERCVIILDRDFSEEDISDLSNVSGIDDESTSESETYSHNADVPLSEESNSVYNREGSSITAAEPDTSQSCGSSVIYSIGSISSDTNAVSQHDQFEHYCGDSDSAYVDEAQSLDGVSEDSQYSHIL